MSAAVDMMGVIGKVHLTDCKLESFNLWERAAGTGLRLKWARSCLALLGVAAQMSSPHVSQHRTHIFVSAERKSWVACPASASSALGSLGCAVPIFSCSMALR